MGQQAKKNLEPHASYLKKLKMLLSLYLNLKLKGISYKVNYCNGYLNRKTTKIKIVTFRVLKQLIKEEFLENEELMIYLHLFKIKIFASICKF